MIKPPMSVFSKTSIVLLVMMTMGLGCSSCSYCQRGGNTLPPAEEESTTKQVFDNHDKKVVYNNPTKATTFTIDSKEKITEIENYHYNDKKGSTPGTISIQDSEGNIIGTWQSVGKEGQGGVQDAYWTVTPNIELPPGTYTIVDSNTETWSQNSGSGGAGMVRIKADK